MWPFRRRPRLIPQLPHETWRIGDVAECLVAPHEWSSDGPMAPAKGSRSLVIGVDRGEAHGGFFEIVGLHIAGFTHRWDARGFRKVVLSDTGADRQVQQRQPEPVS